MANVDMSLDDLINKGEAKAPGGRRGGRPAPGGAAPTRNTRTSNRSTPYSRNKKEVSGDDHMARADVRDVAASENPVLKVGGESKPNSVAGAICNIVRESPGNLPPAVVATGPAAINQAMKAIAIASKYLLKDLGVELTIQPRFEEDIRHSSRVCFVLSKTKPLRTIPTEDDLSSKEKTDPYKLAGAIAGRMRDGEQVACTTKGPVPVLIAVKAIGLANQYVQEEGMEVKFRVGIVDLENPEIRSESITSTYLHFTIISSK